MTYRQLNYILILAFVIVLQGCATYKTVVPSSQKKLIEYVESVEGEKCITIPRIYSGINYIYCVMSGEVTLKSIHTEIALVPLDFIADTILLPYTIIKQSKDGDLVLKKAIKKQK